MEWYNILSIVLGAFGTFFGGGWILNFYNARPKKNSIEIDNMKKVIDELQDVINQMDERSTRYRSETDKTISSLKKEVSNLNVRINIKHDAIYAAYSCKLAEDKERDCVVLKTFKQKCDDCDLYNKG